MTMRINCARLAHSSDVEFAVKDGKLTVGDRPLDVPPEVEDPDDLKERIEGANCAH